MPDDEDEAVARVFKALADPTRRCLLDRLCAEDGQTLGELCRDLDITRQGIAQHLAVLEAAGVVAPVWRGRNKLHYLNPVPLHGLYARWLEKFERPGEVGSLSSLTERIDAISRLRPRLEDEMHASSRSSKPAGP